MVKVGCVMSIKEQRGVIRISKPSRIQSKLFWQNKDNAWLEIWILSWLKSLRLINIFLDSKGKFEFFRIHVGGIKINCSSFLTCWSCKYLLFANLGTCASRQACMIFYKIGTLATWYVLGIRRQWTIQRERCVRNVLVYI